MLVYSATPAIAPRLRDLAVVFESAQSLRALASSTAPFIPIVSTADAETELAPLYRRFHCIAVRPRNDVHAEPDIATDLLTHEAFGKALSAMGITGHEAERLEKESGRSPTILRRRRAISPEIRTPRWAKDAQDARRLIPMALVGAWQATSQADMAVLSALAGRPYPQVEEDVVRLRHGDDAPLWSSGQYHGVKSKLDAIFALSGHITRDDIDKFFTLATNILAEQDPSLDLPEDMRWASTIYGKVRNHSAALRRGVCETLVILAVHSEEFRRRTRLGVTDQINLLIRGMLEPLTLEKLLSHESDLPRYAEAAPGVFLELIERDLAKPDPVVLGLLTPVSSTLFSSCPRAGLLWALEGLAWKHLGRVNKVLAKLSRIDIDDNWGHKPISSLSAIYRSWMPQTAAPLPDRIKALEVLAREFPDIGWQICRQQFDNLQQVGFSSHKPEWRSDAAGAGKPSVGREHYKFCRKALDMALTWPSHNASTLGDLVRSLEGIPDEDKEKVWNLIDTWSGTVSDQKVKAVLRETIRCFALTRHGRRRGLSANIVNRARTASAKLTPQNPVIHHAWLFANDWVEESTDELADEDLDFSKREQRIDAARRFAMQEIWSSSGFDGVNAMLSSSQAPATVGRYTATVMPDTDTATKFIRHFLDLETDPNKNADRCLEGFLFSLEPSVRLSALRGRRCKMLGLSELLSFCALLRSGARPGRSSTSRIKRLPNSTGARFHLGGRANTPTKTGSR